MLESRKVYLTGLAYELGDLYDIRTLEDLRDKDEVTENLLALGLEKYSKSKLTPAEMAREAIQRTLATTTIAREEIDAIVYAVYVSITFANPKFRERQEFWGVLEDLGLRNTYPIGVFSSGCANLHAAIRVALNLIRSGDCNNVLVVTTDSAEGGNTSRIVQPNISITSDAAASCIISSQVRGEFEILQTVQYADAAKAKIDPVTQEIEYFECAAEGIKRTVEKLMSSIDKRPNNFYKIITNNYNTSVMATLCDFAGFQKHQSFTGTLAKFAHSFSADNLISLCDLLHKGSFQTDDLILLLGTGTNMWGATALRKI